MTEANLSTMRSAQPARRYLILLAAVVAVVGGLVAGVNAAAFGLMARPENAALVQLLDGWSRIYKPILYDAEQPEMALFGRSYARDAFDPEEIGRLTGMTLFNFAVSGGAPYENRRFAQSAAANPNLKAIILNLDSFTQPPASPKTYFGFDESILNVTPEGTPNRFVWLNRALATVLSGSAVGNNIQLFWTLAQRAGGATKEDLLSAYQRRDNSTEVEEFDEIRRRILPEPVPTGAFSLPAIPADPSSSRLPEFDTVIDTYCDRDVDIYAYLTPDGGGGCNRSPEFRLAALQYLQARQGECRARLHLFDFRYPNAVTLEGIATEVPVSLYYRPDGHPRPTVGEAMAAVMFGRPFPAWASEAVKADFGTDLLRHPDPIGWWERRLARCEGRWTAEDRALIVGEREP